MEEYPRDHDNGTLGVVHRHNALPGHQMHLNNPTQVFRSDCYNTHVTVEAALLHSVPTFQGNTAFASIDSNDMVAPIICRATKLNWVNLANSIPSFKEDAIPTYKRHLFGSDTIVRAPEHTRTQAPPEPVSLRTRSNRVDPHDPP